MTTAERREHNRKALSCYCPRCDTLHIANALGRMTGGLWMPYRTAIDDARNGERKFYTPNGDLVITPHEWRIASVDEILDQLDRDNAQMVSDFGKMFAN